MMEMLRYYMRGLFIETYNGHSHYLLATWLTTVTFLPFPFKRRPRRLIPPGSKTQMTRGMYMRTKPAS
ncbi:hypothetical protein KSP39_PZI002403 [Platanthera zijinensis]|uniref:Uncharacterized protein n=1 Tax=Platanthera zijinensis TaxID=2320716 RepID=A0AAP0BZY3_9ASPA